MDSQETDILILEPGLELPPLPELLGQGQLIRSATSVANGDIFKWQAPNGTCYLVKTYARNSLFSRMFFGAPCINREWEMLNTLKRLSISYAPSPVAKIGSHTILMEFIPGEKLESSHHYKRRNQELPKKEFYTTLKEFVRALHDAGVAHGDFRRANIMVQPDHTPRIIDWATARTTQKSHRFFFQQFFRSDNYSLVKIVSDAYPDALTQEEYDTAKPGFFLRIGRALRHRFYRHLIKPMFHRKRHHADNGT